MGVSPMAYARNGRITAKMAVRLTGGTPVPRARREYFWD
jgi:hypothetical protein